MIENQTDVNTEDNIEATFSEQMTTPDPADSGERCHQSLISIDVLTQPFVDKGPVWGVKQNWQVKISPFKGP